MILITRQEAIEQNLKYYFTGIMCPKNHISKRLVSNSGCYECRKEANTRRKKTEKYKKMMRDAARKRRENKEFASLEQEKQKKYRNTDKYRLSVRKYNNNYKKNNRDKYNVYDANREAAKKNRTPLWLSEQDKREIKLIYKIAARVSKETGIDHHVDHEIPLQGEFVSGLHVPDNLQLLTAKENMIKNNGFSI